MSILLRKISKKLKDNHIEDYDFEAKIIISHFSALSHGEILFKDEADFCPQTISDIDRAVDERISGVPVQYIIGQWDFYESTFKVGEGVLIPRPETELLCEYVISAAESYRDCVIYDLCSGSGCIGISIKKALPGCNVFLVEKSDKAYSYLKENVRNILDGCEISAIKGDIFDFDSFGNYPSADIIVSNPPYIRRDELPSLQKEVQKEPSMALNGGDDGLDFYRFIVSRWKSKLRDNGIIAFECGENQAEDISQIFTENGFDCEIRQDYNHINRFVIGRKN